MVINKRIATDDDPRLYRAEPRGIVCSCGPCVVCGEGGLNSDCALFVPSRETGEAGLLPPP